MIYAEYHALCKKYREAQKQYDLILAEQEELFARLQPKIKLDKERVAGGNPANLLDEYVIAKERKHIDERLQEAKDIMRSRADLLMFKERDLRQSQTISDQLYVLKWLESMSISQIDKKLPYSRTQIWRILKKIEKTLKEQSNE